jgi:hypothetical protein
MHSTWIRPENLAVVCEHLARLVGTNFDSDDLAGVLAGLEGTNDEENRWFDYALRGEFSISLTLAQDAESPIVLHVRAVSSPEIDRETFNTLAMANCYVIRHP